MLLAAIVVSLSPVWGGLLWHVWELNIRPRLVQAGKIKGMADKLVREHGPRAEEIASIEEDRAWRYSDSFEQGEWRRVRREIKRRKTPGRVLKTKIRGSRPSGQ